MTFCLLSFNPCFLFPRCQHIRARINLRSGVIFSADKRVRTRRRPKNKGLIAGYARICPLLYSDIPLSVCTEYKPEYKPKNCLTTVGIEPTTFGLQLLSAKIKHLDHKTQDINFILLKGCKVEKFALGVEAVNTQRERPKVSTSDFHLWDCKAGFPLGEFVCAI